MALWPTCCFCAPPCPVPGTECGSVLVTLTPHHFEKSIAHLGLKVLPDNPNVLPSALRYCPPQPGLTLDFQATMAVSLSGRATSGLANFRLLCPEFFSSPRTPSSSSHQGRVRSPSGLEKAPGMLNLSFANWTLTVFSRKSQKPFISDCPRAWGRSGGKQGLEDCMEDMRQDKETKVRVRQ